MQIEHELDIDDFIAFQKYHLAHADKSKQPTWVRWFFFVFLGMVALIHVVGMIAWGDWSPYALIVVLIVAVVLGYSLFYRRLLGWVLRRRLKDPAYQKLLGGRKLEITPDGISLSWTAGNSTTLWSGVSKIIATEQHAFFYLSPVEAHILPKRAFPSDAAFWDFVETARRFRDEDQIKHNQVQRDLNVAIKADDRIGP
jgi:hypothetical protein